MGANNRTPFKKLPELLGQLYASEDFAAHVEGLIAERMSAKGETRPEAAKALWADFFEGYRWRSKAADKALDAHGGQFPHELKAREPITENQINAGIYRCIADKLKEHVIAGTPPDTEVPHNAEEPPAAEETP